MQVSWEPAEENRTLASATTPEDSRIQKRYKNERNGGVKVKRGLNKKEGWGGKGEWGLDNKRKTIEGQKDTCTCSQSCSA